MEIVWVPERVGEGRRFRVVVEAESVVSCEHSDALVLLDRSPLASSGPQHRFYFRAAKPGAKAKIRLAAGRSRKTLNVRVIAEKDWEGETFLGEIKLPRIWPLENPLGEGINLKSRHTMVPPQEIGRRKDGPPDAPGELSWTDEELWGLEPPCDIPRWHFLNLDKGCPVHGLAIYHSDPYYPWIVDVRDHPYQVQCPVGGEWYPTSDYLRGDHTSGEYPDDGWGWHAPDGAVFGFISYYLLRRIRFVYGAVGRLADHFLATGDQGAARKVVILLVSLAREHRYLSFFVEHRFRRYEEVVEEPQYRERKDRVSHGPRETKKVSTLAGSGFDDYCINMPYHHDTTTRAYDLVFDRIDSDGELTSFLRRKLPILSDGPTIRRYIETFLFRNAAQAGLDDASSSNLPRPQMGLLNVIRVLDQPECRELVEWLIDGGGQVGRMATNFYYRDGAAYESTGGYNGIHIAAMVPIVEGLRALREQNPDLYADKRFDPIEAHERYHHILRWPLEIVVAQRSCPLIGDTGGVPDTKPIVPDPVMSMSDTMSIYESAVRSFPCDRELRAALELLRRKEDLARRALERGEKGTSGFYGKGPDPDVRQDPRLFFTSRLLDGYGVGILESGEGENRRGLWLYYGDHPGHSHEQVMDIGLFAHRRNLLRHMGYPYSWQHMDTWDASWITHFGVKVVPSDDDPGEPWWRNTVRAFHRGDGGFQFVEARGYGITRDRGEQGCTGMPGHELRRTVCLVDLPDGRFYAVDLFRVDGGKGHWWTFHGLPGALTVEAPEHPVAQLGGTAAGKEIGYGEKTPDDVPTSLAYLYDVRRGSAETPWSATWELEKTEGLKLRITQASPDGGELVVARGRSPHAPKDNPPYELDWVLRSRRHRWGGREHLTSEFTSVIEADRVLPVRGVEPIDAGSVNGVRVKMDGLTHWVLRDEGRTRVRRVDAEVRFQGRAGFVETDSHGVRRMTLVGGGTLLWQGTGIRRGPPDWTGAIVGVNMPNGEVVVEAQAPPPESLVGDYLFISRPYDGREDHDSFAYRVEEIRAHGPGRRALRLNWSPLIANGVVSEHTKTGLLSHGQNPLAHARAYYRGAYLVNHDRSARVQLNDARSGYQERSVHYVVAKEHRKGLVDNFPVRSTFSVEEIGVGDRVYHHGWTEVERRGDGSWSVRSSGVVDLAL